MASRLGILCLLTVALVACTEYVDRTDRLSFGAGDAVHANTVMHMIDPWPVHARNKNIHFNGERMSRAVDFYRAGPPVPEVSVPSVGGADTAQNPPPASR